MIKNSLFALAVILCVFPHKAVSDTLGSQHKDIISTINIGKLGNVEAVQHIEQMSKDITRIQLTFDLKDAVKQDDWQVQITPSFAPSFHWSPHLTPTGNHIIDQHVFRAPAMIVTAVNEGFAIVPDVNLLTEASPVRWYMDLDASNNKLSLGMSNSAVTDHVLFERAGGAEYPKGEVRFGFYIIKYKKGELDNPFRKLLDFYWKRWGHALYEEGNPLKGDLEPYVKHTYRWAFDTWSKHVWQEFNIGNRKVGAPCFIVNTTQSPNYPDEANNREFMSIWNQAWFSSLRSASGLYRYARRTKDVDLLQKANLSKELALAAPRKDGFFYGLIAAEMETVNIGGKDYRRAKSWDTQYWGNSNRNPYTWDARQSPFHVLDMSWTATLMLRWYDELEKDERLLHYATTYADALLKKQDARGYFPAWLDIDTLEPMLHLNDSPETSMSVTFLLKLYDLTKDNRYKDAAQKAMNVIVEDVIPTGRWEDFETYWSCSRWGSTDQVGQKVERNNMYKQCNFSMFWTAEALLKVYKVTKDKKYLKNGQRVLDEMLMTQSAWQPHYIYVKGVGGFGVLNADGEWNDSRASLFAETIIEYGELLKKEEYIERGVSALRSSFAMMYCPENEVTKQQWEKVWSFFDEKDYGFMMENYGHGGQSSKEGEGMGEFTIYDWGNGAASEAYNRIRDRQGEVFMKKYFK